MAATVITAASIMDMMQPGVRGFMQDYDLYTGEWKQIYHVLSSTKDEEKYVELSTLNAAQRFNAGSDIPVGDMGEAFVTFAKNYNYGVGFVITSNAIEDNQYPEEFPNGMKQIKRNMQILEEFEGAALFDNAFNAASPEFLLGDGQPMCSFNHPISGGAVSNKLTDTQLTQTAYQDLVKVVQRFKDYSGLPVKVLPERLLCGVDNQFQAAILTGSPYQPDTANNAVNPLVYGEYTNGKFIMSNYLANPQNFFLLTSFHDGLIHQNRRSIRVEMTVDQANQNLSVYGSQRYRNRCINFRAVAGVQGY